MATSRSLQQLIESPPKIIQGGMGAGVSDWRLANAVSQAGGMGVVSGTALDTFLVRRLEMGDEGGHMKRALEAFPFPAIAEPIYEKYFIEGGKNEDAPFSYPGMFKVDNPLALSQLTAVANFAEVFLAKEGHDNPVGINYLEKIQLPHLPSLYGAILAGVGGVFMGAGIPRQVPKVLDNLAKNERVEYILDVEGADSGQFKSTFDPKEVLGFYDGKLQRPHFYAIVSSNVLATALATRTEGKVNGFIVELPTAGGHNASPRKRVFDESGQPVYGPKDEVKTDKIAELGLPFWLAGGYGRPGKLQKALNCGAQGIQVGTLFAYARESGITPELKERVFSGLRDGSLEVYTDPNASPTGFPLKVVTLDGTMADETTYGGRTPLCDMGFLRVLYVKDDGTVGYRCPAEKPDAYTRKGGVGQTAGRVCVCNGLVTGVGLPQVRSDGTVELPLLTAGDDLPEVLNVLGDEESYSAADVLNYLQQE